MIRKYRVGGERGIVLCVGSLCAFVLVGLYCLKEVTVSTYRGLGSTDTCLRLYSVGTGALTRELHTESHYLAHTSLTGLVGEGKRPVCAGQPLPTQLSLHPGGKTVTSGLAIFSALQNDCNTTALVITCPRSFCGTPPLVSE